MKQVTKGKSSQPKKIKISRSYIDHRGKLYLYETQTERLFRKFETIYGQFSPIIVIMILGLSIVQLYLFIAGLNSYFKHSVNDTELKNHLILFTLISIVITIILKLCWLIIEKNESTINHKRHYSTGYNSI